MRSIIFFSILSLLLPLNFTESSENSLKTFSKIITSNQKEYGINVNGTREPENIELVIENIGEDDIINPDITIDGKWNWSTVESIVQEIVQDSYTDEEKAMAIFQFVRDKRYHWQPTGDNHSDPIKYLNVYGYGFCGSTGKIIDIFAKVAGLKSRYWGLAGHGVAEIFFNDKWHLFDGQTKALYLCRDNKTLAGMEELTKDSWLIERTLHPVADMWRKSHLRRARDKTRTKYSKKNFRKTVANWYATTENNRCSDTKVGNFHKMDLTLRPGEKIILRWDNIGKYYNSFLYNEPPVYANGKIIYTPDFTSNNYRKGLEYERNIKSIADDGYGPNLHVDSCITESRKYRVKNDDAGYIVYKVKSPYVIVGGKIGGNFYRNDNYGDMVRMFISFNGQDWIPVWNADKIGEIMHYQDIDNIISPIGERPKYEYYVKVEFRAAGYGLDPPQESGDNTHAGINTFTIETDFHVSPFSIPALYRNLNKIKYFDESTGNHKVKITHKWNEYNGSHYPNPPENPVYPEDGGLVNTYTPKLKWEKAIDSDEGDKIIDYGRTVENWTGSSWAKESEKGDKIDDYRIQISLRPDCRWALTSNFDVELNSDKCEFQIPQGWLNPEQIYYWRVMAKDNNGNWGEYSKIWTFKTK